MDLKNKTIVLTGASKGLGKEIARKLAQEKCELILISRSKENLTKAIKDLNKDNLEVFFYACDISDPKKNAATFKKILQKHKKIDILINNAGIWYEGEFEKHSSKIIEDIFKVNTLGTIYSTLSVISEMKKQKTGTILNIISVAGIETPGDNGPYTVYTASKHAVRGFTEALEEELKGSGIKVMGFYPGGMNTELFKTAGFNYSDNEDWMMDKKNIADIVLFLLKMPTDILIDKIVVRKFPK